MNTTETHTIKIREMRRASTFYLWNATVLPSFDPAVFSPDLRKEHDLNLLGRGTAVMFRHQQLDLVLRHYQRGGMVRFFNRDLYPFFHLNRTRMWREFELLLELQRLNLPAPVAVAARCEKILFGLCRGDLITQTIPSARTLAQTLLTQPITENQWRDLGTLLARFHCAGVYHADLNANNILLDTSGDFYLLDFDRGELRTPHTDWQTANLSRLLRSLRKLQRRHPQFYFQEQSWTALLSAYQSPTPS